jgi:hypothetical protein
MFIITTITNAIVKVRGERVEHGERIVRSSGEEPETSRFRRPDFRHCSSASSRKARPENGSGTRAPAFAKMKVEDDGIRCPLIERFKEWMNASMAKIMVVNGWGERHNGLCFEK